MQDLNSLQPHAEQVKERPENVERIAVCREFPILNPLGQDNVRLVGSLNSLWIATNSLIGPNHS